MKVSTKGRYGLRAMLDIAVHAQNGNPVLLSDIVKREAIPRKYLEQIFSTLHRAGLVNTVRGRKGGYLLARPADKINLADIVRVLEGPCTLVECVRDSSVCARTEQCVTHDVWRLLSEKVNEVLTGLSLADLARMQKSKRDHAAGMYHI